MSQLTAEVEERLERDELIGRRREREVLDAFIREAGQGGRGLAMLGEPGVGKTALLEYAARRATGYRVLRGVGCESETELSYAALHKVLVPLLGGLDRLPGPQRSALESVFGISAGAPPGPLLVGLAVLTLLSGAAEEAPLLCLVDDEQWLDRASAQALSFATRRLEADPVGVIFAGREPSAEVAGLPELNVRGLSDDDARALLDTSLVGPIDPQVREQIVREARGNPMALLELPRTVTAADLAAGAGLPGSLGAADLVEESFQQRFSELPTDTRRLLQIAAASPAENLALLRRAAKWAGIEFEAATPAIDAGLIEITDRVQFHHPLVRSAVLRSSVERERRRAHAALAAVTDPGLEPDRHAWHRAQATIGPDEEAAFELESSAGRAQARGGLGAAAAFLRRAAQLTPDPAERGRRLLAAANVSREAGALAQAETLLAEARAAPLTEGERADSECARGKIAYDRFQVREAADLLSDAARRLETIDIERARDAHREALVSAIWAGDTSATPRLRRLASGALAVPIDPARSRPIDGLLEGLALLVRDGYAAGAPRLADVLAQLLGDPTPAEDALLFVRARIGQTVALELWDDQAWAATARLHVELARRAGAVWQLTIALEQLAMVETHVGELRAASLTIEHGRSVARTAEETSTGVVDTVIGAWRGESEDTARRIEALRQQARASGAGRFADYATYAHALLANGLGDHESARDAARELFLRDPLGIRVLTISELIEAASRTSEPELMASATAWLSDHARTTSTEWLAGVYTRAQALAAGDDAADALFRVSLGHLARSHARLELARGHLLYGEWLRRRRRRADARPHLRTAYDMFTATGAMGFAGRAERELSATGEKMRRRDAVVRDELTSREAQVAQLARDGLSNPEIAARLFISAHTVQYHLRKVYAKLEIRSRSQLERALPGDEL